MTQKDFFSDLIRKIEAAGIPYMVTGSFASSYHGEPRASNDTDYLSKWAKDLKIDQLLNALLEQAGLLQPPA